MTGMKPLKASGTRGANCLYKGLPLVKEKSGYAKVRTMEFAGFHMD